MEMLSKDLEFIRRGINSASGNGDRCVRTNGSTCTGMGTLSVCSTQNGLTVEEATDID